MTQVLPTDETFAAPDWSNNPIAGVEKSPPWFYFMVGFDPTTDIADSATDSHSGAVYPMRPTGPVAGKGTSALLRPGPDALTSIPCLMTDTNGPTSENTLRSVLLREEASFSHDDQDITVVFGMEVAGGTTEGFAHSGTDGSSPQRGGRFSYPSSPTSTVNALRSMGPGRRGSWSTGGPMNAMGSDDSPINPWPAWQGNVVYFRAGSGNSTVANGAISDTDEVKRLWYYSGINHYAFIAYPNTVGGGSTSDPDLYVELWQLTYTVTGATGGNVPRLLVKQNANGCVDRIDFRQPFRMRVAVENDSTGAPGPYPEITAFIGPYTDLNGDIQPEVQCFRDNVLDTSNTYTLGKNITHTTATGVVSDRNTAKINTYADQTIGFGTATDLLLDVSLGLDPAATEPVIWQVHTGAYSVESKDIPASGDATVRYRDEFKRVVQSGTSTGTAAIVNPIISSVTGVEGVQLNGLFTFDGYTQQHPITPNTTDLNLGLIRRLMLWTDTITDTTAANDYVTLDYDGTALTGVNRPYLVARSFVHLLPSTQYYNHHRKLEFQPGAETGHLSTTTYEVGIHLRGYFDGYTTNGLGCWLTYITNGNGTITYGTVTVGYREHIYTEQNPEAVTGSTHLVARKIWAAGTADGFPALFDATWHSLDFQATAYAEAPTPNTAGLYNVIIDGVEIELDDPSTPYQSGGLSPYTIVEPAPRVAFGRSEGFWFLASTPEVDVSTRSWNPAIARKWTEEALVTDPGPPITDTDTMGSIEVSGEGTPSGELNTSTGALAIAGGGVWDVDAVVDLEVEHARRDIEFESGHRYTSPVYSKHRRRWNVAVRNMDLAVYQALLDFYNSHNGIETPFTFVVPIPDDGTAVGSTAEATESVFVWFTGESLVALEKGPEIYDCRFAVEELLVP